MAENSKIEWTDATWNPITGCSVVSPGCTNCYAMKLAGTRLKHHHSREGLTIDSKAGPVWNGKVRLNKEWLPQPINWKRPRRIFVCAHGDLFHESVPFDWIDQVFGSIILSPQHTFQILTKRPERMQEYMREFYGKQRSIIVAAHRISGEFSTTRVMNAINDGPLKNVWLGVSVENQYYADNRIPYLLGTPAAVRFISAEPLLGHIKLMHTMLNIDWCIVGGESGPGSRPMHPDWARSLRDQCKAMAVPFFFKQYGEYASVSEVEGVGEHFHFPDGATVRRVGKKAAGRTLDGHEWNEMPEVCL